MEHATYTLWTDGAVKLERGSGGAAILEEDHEVVAKALRPAGKLACSYRAECVAMLAGLSLLSDVLPTYRARKRCVVAIFTDSLSLLMALNTGPTTVVDGILRRIWRQILRLVKRKIHLSFQFIFGHTHIEQHDAVDELAKVGCRLPQNVPAWTTDIITAIRRVKVRPELAAISDPPTQRQQLLGECGFAPERKDLLRHGESIAAQFRCGVSRHFGWLHRLIYHEEDMSCRWCRAAPPAEPPPEPPPRSTPPPEPPPEPPPTTQPEPEPPPSPGPRPVAPAAPPPRLTPTRAAPLPRPTKRPPAGEPVRQTLSLSPEVHLPSSSSSAPSLSPAPETPPLNPLEALMMRDSPQRPLVRATTQRLIRFAVKADVPVFCPFCFRVCVSRSSLRGHLHSQHEVPKRSSIQVCRRSLAAPLEGSSIDCPICDYITTDRLQFKEHMLTRHARQPLPSPSSVMAVLAPVRFVLAAAAPPSRPAPVPLQTRRLDLRCERCGKQYRQRYWFDRHRCPMPPPPEDPSAPVYLTPSESNRNRWKCPYCTNTLLLNNCARHYERFHSDLPRPLPPPDPSTTERPLFIPVGVKWRCPRCHIVRTKYRIRRHFHDHHPGHPDPVFPAIDGQVIGRPLDTCLAVSSPTTTAPGRVLCPQCGDPIVRSRMRAHYTRKHPGVPAPDYAPGPATTRRRATETSARYACPHCAKSYSSSDCLRRHHRSKHGNLPWRIVAPTPVASTTTPTVPDGAHDSPASSEAPEPLPQREPSADTAFPCRCELCPARHRTENGLVNHVQQHHPEHRTGLVYVNGEPQTRRIPPKTLQCPICPATFTGPATLSVHLTRSHDIGELVKAAPWMREHRCEETPEHILCCPGLRVLRLKHRVSELPTKENLFSACLSSFLCEMFDLPDPVLPDAEIDLLPPAPPSSPVSRRDQSAAILASSLDLSLVSASALHSLRSVTSLRRARDWSPEGSLHAREAVSSDEADQPAFRPTSTRTGRRPRSWELVGRERGPRQESPSQ
ncbi:RNase H [Novymonas esmeraldas]|uniref:RNase H n=1 Tax=Novymonas esmeraldas TaxID=1808958 RepID=A0AAW0EN69_9TRYP